MKKELTIKTAYTKPETRSVERYFNELSRNPLICPAEEAELARSAKRGERAAINRLVRANLRFVVSVAKQYQHKGLPLADLISEGNIGLMEAVGKFDETKGFKFISYAVWHIRQKIMDAISDQSRTIRLPQSQTDFFRDLMEKSARMEQDLQRLPTVAELASALSPTEEKVEGTLLANRPVNSYDCPDADPEGEPLERLDLCPERPDDEVIAESEKQELDGMLRCLPGREQLIVRLSFGLTGERPMIPEEIGPKVGLSTERVRQLKISALNTLRQAFCHPPV